METGKTRQIATFALSGLLVLGVGGTALAAPAFGTARQISSTSADRQLTASEFDASTPDAPRLEKGGGIGQRRIGLLAVKDRVLDILGDLVSNGVISQETSDKITAFAEEKSSEREALIEELKDMTEEERQAYLEGKKSEVPSVKESLLSMLVEEGILTQDESNAIEAYVEKHYPARADQPGRLLEKRIGALSENMLDKLVENGVISQDIADKITSFVQEKSEERKAMMEELKDMTEEEREAYLESKKSEMASGEQGLLSELVAEGILTQDQADAIKGYLKDNLGDFKLLPTPKSDGLHIWRNGDSSEDVGPDQAGSDI